MYPTPRVRAMLFDMSDRDARQVDPLSVDVDALADSQLLWLDIVEPHGLREIAGRLRMPARILAAVETRDATPALLDEGSCFWLRANHVAYEDHDDRLDIHPIDLIAGRNFVVTFRTAHPPGTDAGSNPPGHDLGRLSAASVVAAQLHALLSTYFEAVSRIEIAVERIDQEILEPGRTHCMHELRRLLRSTSQLRRALAAHRTLFTALSRPDFRPADGDEPRRHFAALDDKYERAMDVVENSRDLVIGCFELFSSRTALDTNETMRTLTFLTVLIGVMAVAAGVLGMNFETTFFASEAGFWITIALMIGSTLVALFVARRLRWM